MSKKRKVVTSETSVDVNVDTDVKTIYRFTIFGVVSMRELQDTYINWVLPQCNNDLDVTAAKLGITSRTIYNRIKYGAVKVQDP